MDVSQKIIQFVLNLHMNHQFFFSFLVAYLAAGNHMVACQTNQFCCIAKNKTLPAGIIWKQLKFQKNILLWPGTDTDTEYAWF